MVVMWVWSKMYYLVEDLEEMEEIFILFCIYVVKGFLVISFVRLEYICVYVRVGIEIKLMIDYEDLFN